MKFLILPCALLVSGVKGSLPAYRWRKLRLTPRSPIGRDQFRDHCGKGGEV